MSEQTRIAYQLKQIFDEQVVEIEIPTGPSFNNMKRYTIEYLLFGQLIDVVQVAKLTNFGVINEFD